jgi:putative ABC transport system permease protein
VHGGAQWEYVTNHFFDAFKIPVIRGRVFTDRDVAGTPLVVVINEAFAKKYWPKENPIGQHLDIGVAVGPPFVDLPREIVGVIADARDNGLNFDPQPEMFILLPQVREGIFATNNRFLPLSWVVRSTVQPMSLATPIQKEFQSLADLPLANVRTMDVVVARSTARDEFNTLVLGIFAFLAILLASIGLYGLMSYTVQQRTLEFGIRLALGANAGSLRNMIVGQSMLLALVGIVAGLGAAYGLTRFMASLLFDVKPNDVFVFASVAGVLAIVAFLPSYLPAKRAVKINPIIALRYE